MDKDLTNPAEPEHPRKHALPDVLDGFSPPWTITFDGEIWTASRPCRSRLMSPYPDSLADMISAAEPADG